MRRAIAILLVSFTFAGCAQSGEESSNTAEAVRTTIPAFFQDGTGGATAVGGKAGDKLQVATAVQDVATRMSTIAGNVPGYFAAAGVRLAPADVAPLTTGATLPKAFGYDLMSLAGSGYVPANRATDGRSFEDNVRCVKADPAQFQRIAKQWGAYTAARSDESLAAADREELKAKMTVLVSALLGAGEPRTLRATMPAFFKCSWGNDDDTTAKALVTMDGITGEVRAVAGVNGP